MNTGECNQCRYFAGQKDAIGDCRQGPPATILYPNPDYPAAAYAQSEWPRVDGKTGWCGRFKRK